MGYVSFREGIHLRFSGGFLQIKFSTFHPFLPSIFFSEAAPERCEAWNSESSHETTWDDALVPRDLWLHASGQEDSGPRFGTP